MVIDDYLNLSPTDEKNCQDHGYLGPETYVPLILEKKCEFLFLKFPIWKQHLFEVIYLEGFCRRLVDMAEQEIN